MPRVMKFMRALRWSVPALIIGAAPGVLQAQNEATLRQTFEGQTVAVGSRFNIRFDEAVPADYLTPEGVMLALEKYVTFSAMKAAAAPGDTAAAEEPLDGVTSLKKGMTLAEVERLLGPAAEATSADVGGLTVLIRTYMTEGQRVRTRFANGVLIEYTIHSD